MNSTKIWYDNINQIIFFYITKEGIRLYFNAGKFAHFSDTYEKVMKSIFCNHSDATGLRNKNDKNNITKKQ